MLGGTNRVIRGGNWNSNAQNCRSAYRNNNSPDNRNNNVGFRVLAARHHAGWLATEQGKVLSLLLLEGRIRLGRGKAGSAADTCEGLAAPDYVSARSPRGVPISHVGTDVGRRP